MYYTCLGFGLVCEDGRRFGRERDESRVCISLIINGHKHGKSRGVSVILSFK
jgi:hypothetical protein